MMGPGSDKNMNHTSSVTVLVAVLVFEFPRLFQMSPLHLQKHKRCVNTEKHGHVTMVVKLCYIFPMTLLDSTTFKQCKRREARPERRGTNQTNRIGVQQQGTKLQTESPNLKPTPAQSSNPTPCSCLAVVMGIKIHIVYW